MKQNVAIMFGGRSAEHEISLISGQNIVRALDRDRFAPILIAVDKAGHWFLQEEAAFMALDPNPKTIALKDFSRPLAVIPGQGTRQILNYQNGEFLPAIDVVFAILHGPYGEDGSFQGFLRQLDLPFVGPDVLSSALCMDKHYSKVVMTQAGIPNARYRLLTPENRDALTYEGLAEELGGTLFIKPANMGSSVGVSKVRNLEEYKTAVDLAFQYDRKVLVEEMIVGRELECAVKGAPGTSTIPGEILPVDGFYSYEAKYVDEKGAQLVLPAENLSAEDVKRLKAEAVRAYDALGCSSMARVDFFMQQDGTILLNEINTLPGFTSISMFPALWGLEGLTYSDLISELLDDAIQRQKQFSASTTGNE